MAGLVVAGTNLEVTQFEELPPRVRGEITTAFDNTLRSSVSSEKRRFRATTSPVNKTTKDAIKSNTANGVTVTVAGDVLTGSSLSCKVTASFTAMGIGALDAGYNVLFAAHLDIEQV